MVYNNSSSLLNFEQLRHLKWFRQANLIHERITLSILVCNPSFLDYIYFPLRFDLGCDLTQDWHEPISSTRASPVIQIALLHQFEWNGSTKRNCCYNLYINCYACQQTSFNAQNGFASILQFKMRLIIQRNSHSKSIFKFRLLCYHSENGSNISRSNS